PGTIEDADRAEELAARDVVGGGDVFQDGWREVVAGPVRGVVEPVSSRHHPPPARDRALHCGQHVLELSEVDERAEIVLVARTDLQLLALLDEAISERLVDGLEHDDATPGRATLAGVAETREQR